MSKDKNCPWSKPIQSKPAEANPESPVNPSSRNALKHGCCAVSTLILPHESEADYKTLTATWCQAYNPQSDLERHLVQELINADWLLQRTTIAYAQVEADLYTLNPNPSGWSETHERKLGRYLRYRTAQANLVAKARKAVEDFRKSRLAEKVQSEKQTIAEERLIVYKLKNRPEANWKEHLQSMKEKAIAMGFTPPAPAPIDPIRRY